MNMKLSRMRKLCLVLFEHTVFNLKSIVSQHLYSDYRKALPFPYAWLSKVLLFPLSQETRPCSSLPWAWRICIPDMAIPMFWMLIYVGTHLPTLSIKAIFQNLSGCQKPPPLLNLWFNALYTLMSVLTASCVCKFCSLMSDRKPRMDFFLLVSVEQIEDTLLPLALSQNSVFFPLKSTTSTFLLKEPFL